MKWGFAGIILLIVLIILISGCTQTGTITGEQELTPEEELILEEFLNKTGEIQEQNVSPIKSYEGYTEPQNITQPLGCPGTCDDGDNCTYDYCSEDTSYECVHAERLCPNFVRICPDGVRVICENTCKDDACTRCDPDCSEHQLPVCELTQDDCGACQILDTDNCECAQITSCVYNDSCCPGGCDYTNDNDCEEPEGECSDDADCNDDNNCTIDICGGIPKNCSYEEITECIPDDGCCPSGCNSTTDNNCPEEPPEEPEVTGNYLIINEIMYNPSTEQGSDSYKEWIELYNPNNNDIDVSGWTLCDSALLEGYVNHSVGETYLVSGTIIPANGYVIITDGGSGTDVYENFNVDSSSLAFHVNTSSMCTNNLGNTEDTITLVHFNGTVLESLTYSDDWGADGNSKTLKRYNNTWGESLIDGGTPGSENTV